MGKHIHTHLLKHKERAQYGKELFPLLAAEINISQALLGRMVQKSAVWRELTWSHYKAYVEKVLDGDTLWAVLDLGFKIFIRQKIRLHRLDAPPVETDEGVKAMNYLNNKLKPLDFIVVKTHWRDKFDRYLADIFYLQDEEDFLVVTDKGKYLKQEL